jgi:hypothetical protein
LHQGAARKAKIPWVVGVIRCGQLEIELELRRYHDSWNIRERRHGATPSHEVESGKVRELAVKVNEIRVLLLCELKSCLRTLEAFHANVGSDSMQHVHKELRGEFIVFDNEN